MKNQFNQSFLIIAWIANCGCHEQGFLRIILLHGIFGFGLNSMLNNDTEMTLFTITSTDQKLKLFLGECNMTVMVN